MTGNASKRAFEDEQTPLVQKRRTLACRLSASAKLVLTSGAGMLADGYDMLVIDLVVADIADLHPGAMGPAAKSFTVSMTLIGVILGMLSFGSVVDILGAKAASMATSLIIAVAAILSACCVSHPGFPLATQLGLCRFVLGVGIGGEYPVSATLAVEEHSSVAGGDQSDAFYGSRAQLQTLICGMFNVGSVLTGAVVLGLLHSDMPPEWIWRLALGLGAVPAMIAFIARSFLPTGRQLLVEDSTPECSSESGWGYTSRVYEAVGPRRMLLLGTCLSWAVFNMTQYGQSSFRSIISDRIYGEVAGRGVPEQLHANAVFSVHMSLFSLAGTAVAVLLVENVWRFQLQLLGFGGVALAMWACGVCLGALPDSVDWPLLLCNYLSVILYAQVSVSTYLIPAESFPAKARATCFGISAAAGKLGAFVGTALFPVCEAAFGLSSVLVGCGCISIFGAIITLMLTPRINIDPAKLDCDTHIEDILTK